MIAPGSTPAVEDRRTRRKARTRRALYEAAMRLFLARGYDAVTVDEICAEADTARATFFLHFSTKDALLAEYGAEAREDVEVLLASHAGTAAEVLRDVLARLAERAIRHGAIVELVVRETLARPDAVARSAVQQRGLGAQLADVVAAGQRRGELRRGVHPDIAAATVVASYFAIISEWVRRREAFDLRTAVEQALDVVLYGLVAAPKGARRARKERAR